MSDSKFFTNTEGDSLLNRFRKTLEHSRYFDVLVGYFRSSGFKPLAEALGNTEKIRLLVGINTDQETLEAVTASNSNLTEIWASHMEMNRLNSQAIRHEFAESQDSEEVEDSARLFIEWLKNGRLEIRGHPSRAIHAKVYITRYQKDYIPGSVITGSSNFSFSGLFARPEFNVELRDPFDLKFALDWFEKLWTQGIDLGQSFLETVTRETWLNDEITPYELFLKCLYEYFQEDINLETEEDISLPEGSLRLKYQHQAVVSAKRILETHNGVFLSDVVGLGKTYISALLLRQLKGHKLIIVPPVLMEYWETVLRDFSVTKFKVASCGKMADLAAQPADKFHYILVDEAHRFKNDQTLGYDYLKTICQNKKVILVSATPLSNRFSDLLNQLLLFQAGRKSTIPGISNIKNFFNQQTNKINEVKKNHGSDEEQKEALKNASASIRDKILKHVMIRRTRSEINKYFQDDLNQQNIFFPDLKPPERLTYTFDPATEKAFNKTVKLLPQLTYARYTPLLYLVGDMPDYSISGQSRQGQQLMKVFMKIILVKRLESSQFAFKETLKRFIQSLKDFLRAFDEKGVVYMGRDASEASSAEADDDLDYILENKDVVQLPAGDFIPAFRSDLEQDMVILEEILNLWQPLRKDPKKEAFISQVTGHEQWKNEKILVFTESRETAEHLFEALEREIPGATLSYSSLGGLARGQSLSPAEARKLVLKNFDPNHENPADDYRVLVSTDVLAEGINLHRAGLVLNYDLPWNPTRLMQRVGRVNRVGTKHKEIHVFNFLPTSQSDSHLGLEKNITNKIDAFHTILGDDSRYLSPDEEPVPRGFFGNRLMAGLASAFEMEQSQDDSELKYLNLIRKIQNTQPELFDRLKRLPPKSRSGRQGDEKLIVFFRSATIKKFVQVEDAQATELNFLDAAATLECPEETPRAKISKEYYFSSLSKAREFLTQEAQNEEMAPHCISSTVKKLLNGLSALQRVPTLAEDDRIILSRLYSLLEDDRLSKSQVSAVKKALNAKTIDLVLAQLKSWLPGTFFSEDDYEEDHSTRTSHTSERAWNKPKIILAEYFNPSEGVCP